MSASRPSASLFEDAIDAPLWLDADHDTPYVERVRRDRAISEQLGSVNDVARVRGWWRRVERGSAEAPGARLARIRRLVSIAMFVAGAIVGYGVALTAFHYDGSTPVNVVTLLAALVAVPLLLLALTLLMLIPGGVPGLRAVQELLASVNPGALAASLYRRIAAPPHDALALFGWHPGRSAAANGFAKWQLLNWSQTAALGFFAAALATAAALVAFTDLAFGWSTTLRANPSAIERIVAALATPWAAWAPDAAPDLALIERSQFFRLDGVRALDGDAPRALAQWWSFTLLAIVTYGLVPRLVLWIVSMVRLRSATRTLLLEDPRVTALLDRMAAPAIETTAPAPEHARTAPAARDDTHHRPLVGTARAVVWAGALDPATADAYARRALGIGLGCVVEAGGDRTLADDRAAIARICEVPAPTVIVFTRAWEPPLLEFGDFVRTLRAALGAQPSIVVVPVGESTGIEAVHRETWARAIGAIADPRVYLEAGGVLEGGAA